MSSGPWYRWNILEVEAILDALARTPLSLRHVMAARGYTAREYHNFICFTFRRADWAARYLSARRVKVEVARSVLMGMSDAELLAHDKPKRFVNRECLRIQKLKPVRQRRAEAALRRAAHAVEDPAAARLQDSRRRAKRLSRRETE
jgi:hypothetical protein